MLIANLMAINASTSSFGSRLSLKTAELLLVVGFLITASFTLSGNALADMPYVNVPPICENGECRTVDVRQFGLMPDDGMDDSAALQSALAQVGGNTILHFSKGIYDFKRPVRQDQLTNVRLEGEFGTEFQKSQDFQGEYLLITRSSHQLAFRNLVFRGGTKDRKRYQWGESGLYVGSSDGLLIENCRFYDFGDAAIRVTSTKAGWQGVASKNTIVRNNYFDNVTQITTTSNLNGVGGTRGYLLENNEFYNLKGSVKFASRTAGAGDIIVRENRIYGVPDIATSIGIEIVSNVNVIVQHNQISNSGSFAMNIYSNPTRDSEGADWGNLLIQENSIHGCQRGIRISAQPYSNGYVPHVGDISILDNRFNILGGKAIQISNGKTERVIMRGNLPMKR